MKLLVLCCLIVSATAAPSGPPLPAPSGPPPPRPSGPPPPPPSAPPAPLVNAGPAAPGLGPAAAPLVLRTDAPSKVILFTLPTINYTARAIRITHPATAQNVTVANKSADGLNLKAENVIVAGRTGAPPSHPPRNPSQRPSAPPARPSAASVRPNVPPASKGPARPSAAPAQPSVAPLRPSLAPAQPSAAPAQRSAHPVIIVPANAPAVQNAPPASG